MSTQELIEKEVSNLPEPLQREVYDFQITSRSSHVCCFQFCNGLFDLQLMRSDFGKVIQSGGDLLLPRLVWRTKGKRPKQPD